MAFSGFQGAGSTIARSKGTLLCTAAIFFIMLSGPVLNSEIYARIAPYFGIGREISTFINALAYFIIALVSVKRPSLFDFRLITIAIIALALIGGFLLALALEMQSPSFIMVGLFCRAIGHAWATTIFSIALTTIASTRTVLIVIGAGTVVSGFSWYVAPASIPLLAACLIVMSCAIVPILLTYNVAKTRFEAIRQGAAASSLGISDAFNLKSLQSLLFCMLLFSVASGYSLTFNEQSHAPIDTVVENVVMALIVVLVLVSKPERADDGLENQLFSFAALLIIAGFLVAPFSFGQDSTVTNTLLRLGRDCFNLLVWMVIASFGRRNIYLLLPIMGATRCMSSLGTNIGAAAGHTTNNLIYEAPVAAEAITAIFAFAFIAFLWLGFRGFSFSQAINGVKKVAEPEIARVGDHILQRAQSLSAEYGLTERETAILGLLAKGRDGRFIADEFVLSYNTVKTHIKHIYQKLDVHSRQELLDLIAQP